MPCCPLHYRKLEDNGDASIGQPARGITLTVQTNGLLTSVADVQGRTHTLVYDPPVPDENGTGRKKLQEVDVQGPGSPNYIVRKWFFSYRDAANPDLAYGGQTGNYTGDLVIKKNLSRRHEHLLPLRDAGDGGSE